MDRIKTNCLLLLLVSVFKVSGSAAQSPPMRSFSVKEGLPSGIVYDCLEDKNGFMWFATEAGLARFGGVNFKVYTTEDGLSNNAVLRLLEDDDGSIWIFPFGREPCIFDFEQQRIITAKENTMLAELGKYAEHLSAIKTAAGIMLHAEHNLFVIKNRIMTKLGDNIRTCSRPFFYSGDSFCYIEKTFPVSSDLVTVQYFSRQKDGWKFRDADTVGFQDKSIYVNGTLTKQEIFGRYQIFSQPGGFIIYEINDWTKPRFISCKEIAVKGQINSIRVLGSYLYVCTTAGLLKYDSNFKLAEKIWPEYSISRIFQDSKGNKWAGTLDGRGVLMTLGNGAMVINRAEGLPAENISAIAAGKTGIFFTGDANGNISQLRQQGDKIVTSHLGRLNSGIRQLLKSGENHIAVADRELAIVYDKTVKVKAAIYAFKSAIQTDNSDILIGTSNGLIKTNMLLSSFNAEMTLPIRFSATGVLTDTVFFGNNKGLFYIPGYSKLDNDKSAAITSTLITEPVTAINCSADGIVWVGTNTLGVIAYRNNRIDASISLNTTGRSGNYIIKRIFAEPNRKRVWVATNKGLQLISYSISGGNVITSRRLITSRDGLTDDDVNDVLLSGDTVFAATIKGISYFRDNLPETAIPLFISGITLNHKDSALSGASEYTVNYSRNSFSIHYSGICYTCDGKIMYKYRLLGPDRDSNWIATPVNTVEFGGLRPGRYVFQVTTDASGTEQVIIVIKPAFWQTKWFYMLAGASALLLLYLTATWYRERLKRKQKEQISQSKRLSELELAALQSQMNPHFIFNSMNSLQTFILTKDIHNANEYLAGFSKLLRLFLEASRSRFTSVSKEVELLRLYIELEQMRQITKFSYELEVEETVSPSLQIPSVIIQPFVENAILHGLRYLEDTPGMLHIRMMKDESLFTCIIEDNGAGRKKVQQMQQQKNRQYKSYGTSIIEEKIDALRRMENIDITVDIADRDTATGAGTVVTIKFKIAEEYDQNHNS